MVELFFRKYAFDNKEQADALLANIIADVVNVVIYDVEGEYDEEGNELVAPVISDKYHLDIMFHQPPPSAFDKYEVFPHPDNSEHSYAGMHYLYIRRYEEVNK